MNKILSKKYDFSYFDQLIEDGISHAIFDIDNTITKSNIGQLYMFLKHEDFSIKIFWALWFTLFNLSYVPFYYFTDHFNRAKCQSLILKRYREYPLSRVEQGASILFKNILSKKFISYTHDLVFYLNNKINVVLLSTNIEPVVKQYSTYFGVPYKCFTNEMIFSNDYIKLTDIESFKENFIREYHPSKTVAIADSKHDIPILRYVKHPVVVTKKIKPWMRDLNGKILINDQLIE